MRLSRSDRVDCRGPWHHPVSTANMIEAGRAESPRGRWNLTRLIDDDFDRFIILGHFPRWMPLDAYKPKLFPRECHPNEPSRAGGTQQYCPLDVDLQTPENVLS